MAEDQFKVLKHISLALAATLEREVGAALGRRVPVLHRYQAEEVARGPCLTLLHVEAVSRGENLDREYESTGQGEQFRAQPLPLRSRFLVSAWAPPPDDQELLGAVLRTFHDHAQLEVEGQAAEAAAYDAVPEVSLATLPFPELERLAQAFRMPLAPSASYWVSYQIRSARVTPIKRVLERVTDYRQIKG